MNPISRRPLTRLAAFAALCLVSLALAVGYVILTRSEAAGNADEGRRSISDPAAIAEVQRRPHLLFRATTLGGTFGKLSMVPLDRMNGPRYTTSLACERVHLAAGTGLCLSADRGVFTTYYAHVLDERHSPRHTLRLGGIPSRTRVAPDGRLAALTYFVSGDSYAAGGFSTRTLIVDPETGGALASLEEFAVSRDGKRFQSVDFNFWGVTYSKEPNVFYATLASAGKTYLIRGNTLSRTATVIRENVECPSLSPDDSRLAFKRRMPGMRVLWRIHVLDLASGTETAVAESRSVDDQVEWLDDRTILYALPSGAEASASMDVWAVPADGTGAPRLVLHDADSPAVVRIGRD